MTQRGFVWWERRWLGPIRRWRLYLLDWSGYRLERRYTRLDPTLRDVLPVTVTLQEAG